MSEPTPRQTALARYAEVEAEVAAVEWPGKWVKRARCRPNDAVWFPDPGGSAEAARRVCQECPVKAECLQFAIDTNQKFGVWGGHTWREVRAIRLEQEQAS